MFKSPNLASITLFLLVLCLGGPATADPQGGPASLSDQSHESVMARGFASNVEWITDFETACRLAQSQSKVILAFAPSLTPAKGSGRWMEESVLSSGEFKNLMSQCIPYLHVTVDDHSGKFAPARTGRLTILSAQGTQPYYLSADQCDSVKGVQRGLWIAGFRSALEKRAGDDAEAAQELAAFESRWRGFSSEGWTVPGTASSIAVAPAPTSGTYTIHGDYSSNFKSGEIVIFQPEKKKAAAPTGMASMGMSSMGSAKSKNEVPGELMRAALVDGKFEFTGKVEESRPVYYYLLDGITHDGSRMAPTKGLSFILEPGEYSMVLDAQHNFRVQGSYFNDLVFGSWQNSEAYRDLRALIPHAFGSVAGETKEQEEARTDIGMDIFDALMDIEGRTRRRLALAHPNLYVRQLVLETTSYGGTWVLEGARGILAEDPSNEWARGQVESGEAYLAKRQRQAQAGSVGGRYLPFSAASLDGTQISLSSTCRQNKYVLLEFWASWCGPCRQEIPHLKEAYSHYADKGFEIFAYTLDDKHADWAKASELEDLPWIDTGLGSKSDPTLLYEVTGVPANYLIDTQTGQVVARNLRGNDLGVKLKELLGE